MLLADDCWFNLLVRSVRVGVVETVEQLSGRPSLTQRRVCAVGLSMCGHCGQHSQPPLPTSTSHQPVTRVS